MKKLILSVTAIVGFSVAGFAQGITFLDGSFPSSDTSIAGVPNSADLNLELLYGTSAGNVTTPVVTLLLSSSANVSSGAIGQTYTAAGDISTLGFIDDQTGNEYNLAAGNYFFQVLAWTGNNLNSYSAALASGQTGVYAGSSSVFPESIAASPAPPGDVSAVGVINLTQVPTTIVPEPSTLAMAGVGLASMLFFRRKVS
jgi:hypothetical protein